MAFVDGARLTFIILLLLVQFAFLCWFLWAAYEIRLYPVKDFGYIIHEFDPWFNYRAAEYLAENGLAKFNKWYDYESWYPLGRPIGTTIYPGMQITAVAIWEASKIVAPMIDFDVPDAVRSVAVQFERFLRGRKAKYVPSIPKKINMNQICVGHTCSAWDVNAICVMIPAWFGSIASLFTGLLAYEVTRSVNAGLCAVGIMAVIPAHLMRSVAGEFDNEAVAMAAIVATSWLWVRSVRTPRSWLWSIPAGLSYVYMVAAWGGYIFVINLIGVHALLLVVLGRFNFGVHKAYTLFFIIGTAGAIQIPVVGLQPLRSLEQMGPLGVFLGYQVLAFCDYWRKWKKLGVSEFQRFRIRCVMGLAAAVVIVVIILAPFGYFGPLSSRIRGLFVKHTKTGNPLVDSVAEHQPAQDGIYTAYLHKPLDYWFFGFVVCLFNRNNAAYFIAVYAYVAAHFSMKMSRLVLICGPICAIGAAIWLGWFLDFIVWPFLLLLGKKGYKRPEESSVVESEPAEAPQPSSGNTKKGNAKANGAKEKSKGSAKPKQASKKASKIIKRGPPNEWEEEEPRTGGMAEFKTTLKQELFGSLMEGENGEMYYSWRDKLDNDQTHVLARVGLSLLVILLMMYGGALQSWHEFVMHADEISQSMSNPQVVYNVPQRDGRILKVEDYLHGYQWIDKNTPKDARVMAWWDYGYQITGIAKRTSIADGNTWNHEHIATLGKMLTSNQTEAWSYIRHLADYVLVWAGGGGDDLAKSPHLARIGNSVFPDHCGDADPKCQKFGFLSDYSSPTPMMKKSLLFNLCQDGEEGSPAKVNKKYFQEVHTTKYGLMRVYKVMNISEESKEWIADPVNKICDAPGSWYCVGQYPPALQDSLISQRRNFAQVEDFNKKGEKSAYTKMIEEERAGRRAASSEM